MIKINAFSIDKLLRDRHTNDIYVPQCKTGATWTNDKLQILDAWVMKKSWSKPLTIGYEIKVSRADFLADEKWRGYLPYCNKFYFVCPGGLILPMELPSEIGLLYCSKTGTKLFEKKKAVYREVQIPESLFRYILMNKVMIKEKNIDIQDDKREYWKKWMENKAFSLDFGTRVSKSIRREIYSKIDLVEKENKRLKYQIKGFEEIKKIITEVGMNPNGIESWRFICTFRQKIKSLAKDFPDDLDEKLAAAMETIATVKKMLIEKLLING